MDEEEEAEWNLAVKVAWIAIRIAEIRSRFEPLEYVEEASTLVTRAHTNMFKQGAPQQKD